MALLLLACTSPLGAQEQPQVPKQVTAEQALESARQAYGPAAPKPRCEGSTEGEIVVCGEEEDQSQFRVQSSTELDRESEKALDDGLPRAPDVSGPGIFTGPATIGSLCVPGLQKCPPPPAYFIDFSALPDTPAGSDAERVGQGLAPRGNDGSDGSTAEPPAPPAEPVLPRG